MTVKRVKARLTLDIEYEIDLIECKELNMDPDKVRAELINYLEAAPDFLSGEGMFTHSLPATVEFRDHAVVLRG